MNLDETSGAFDEVENESVMVTSAEDIEDEDGGQPLVDPQDILDEEGEALEEAFEKYHEELNCFIVEPLLQGAGGMRMYDISFLERARQLCDRYGVLLIFDEVATGFGRTGNRFVADLVQPDILVLGKALTGGYIGHAVTVANEKVFQGFYDDNPDHALMHGPTFMGNALACSVALKSIELFETQDYMAKIRRIEEITRREMAGFADKRIEEVRIMGGCVCVEVKDSQVLQGYQQFAYERGVFSRPFLNTSSRNTRTKRPLSKMNGP